MLQNGGKIKDENRKADNQQDGCLDQLGKKNRKKIVE